MLILNSLEAFFVSILDLKYFHQIKNLKFKKQFAFGVLLAFPILSQIYHKTF
jgi:hypothetical protein